MEAIRVIPSGHEADELQYHNQWARRRLRQSQSIYCLRMGNPPVTLSGCLRDVGKNGISAAKSDQRGLCEEAVLLSVKTTPPLPDSKHNKRQKPEEKPAEKHLQGALN